MKKLLVIKVMNTPHDHSEVFDLIDMFVDTYKNANPNDEVKIEPLVFSELPMADGSIIKMGIKAKITPFLLSAKDKQLLAQVENYKTLLERADRIVVFDPIWDHEVVRKIEGWRSLLEKMGKTPTANSNDVDDVVGGRKLALVQMVDPNHEDYASKYLEEVLYMTGYNGLDIIRVTKPVTESLDAIHSLATKF